MNTGRIAGTVAIAAIMVGCVEATPTSSVREISAFAAFINPPTAGNRVAQNERVEVCKDYVMTTGATPPTANFTANGSPFTLANGECKEVWITGATTAVTVTETALNGFLTQVKVTPVTGPVIPLTDGLSATVSPSGAPPAGFLIEFVNTEEVNTGGCTLTQGYWKTHSAYGPASYSDPIWASVGGPDATFFFSGVSWYTLFWTAPKGGNAYIQLAHQYMAAVLNSNNGALPVPPELALATAFFNDAANTPATVYTKAQTAILRGYAGVLGAFNEGTTGPGHCQD